LSELDTAIIQKPLYRIKANGKTVRFIWSSNPKKPLKGSTDLKSRVGFHELLKLAGGMGCQANGSEILLPNQDIYNRLLIYACVRNSLRKPSGVLRLADCVVEMSGWDALYWASAFRKLWWSSSNYRSLRKAVKAFKLFFNVE
jgi:hypothetical protein